MLRRCLFPALSELHLAWSPLPSDTILELLGQCPVISQLDLTGQRFALLSLGSERACVSRAPAVLMSLQSCVRACVVNRIGTKADEKVVELLRKRGQSSKR